MTAPVRLAEPADVERPITIRPAPRRDPPYDDELPARHLSLVGPHDRPLPFAPLHPPHIWATRRRSGPPGPAVAPDAEQFARRLLIALLEALAGRRTPQQLVRHVSRPVHTRLFATRATARRGSDWSGPSTLRAVKISSPAAGVAEVAAVVDFGPRCRAVALRLERRDGHWLCTRLQLG